MCYSSRTFSSLRLNENSLLWISICWILPIAICFVNTYASMCVVGHHRTSIILCSILSRVASKYVSTCLSAGILRALCVWSCDDPASVTQIPGIVSSALQLLVYSGSRYSLGWINRRTYECRYIAVLDAEVSAATVLFTLLGIVLLWNYTMLRGCGLSTMSVVEILFVNPHWLARRSSLAELASSGVNTRVVSMLILTKR